MLTLKKGVGLKNLQPQTILGMIIVDQIIVAYFNNPTYQVTITSLNDSLHMDGSKHYEGKAFDLRTHYWDAIVKIRIYDRLIQVLVPLGFDVIFEGKETPNEHIHIEYDPKD